MSRALNWVLDGWRPAGPGQCRCPRCSARVSTNALARRSHEKACDPERSERQARWASKECGVPGMVEGEFCVLPAGHDEAEGHLCRPKGGK